MGPAFSESRATEYTIVAGDHRLNYNDPAQSNYQVAWIEPHEEFQSKYDVSERILCSITEGCIIINEICGIIPRAFMFHTVPFTLLYSQQEGFTDLSLLFFPQVLPTPHF